MTTQIVEPSDDQVALAAASFKLLADPTRLRVVWTLLHGEHSVNELADHIGANTPAVSQQLAKLRMARLVRTRRDGNRIFYSAQDVHVKALVEQALNHAEHVVAGLPDHDDSVAARPRRRRGA